MIFGIVFRMFFVLHANICGQAIPHHGHSHLGHHEHSHGNQSLVVDIVSDHHHHHENAVKPSISSKNINVQAALIHVIGDFVQSVGVLLAAILIKIKVSELEMKYRNERIRISHFSPNVN